MNTADKKRIEKMLRDRSFKALGIRGGEWGYEYDQPGEARDDQVKPTKAMTDRLARAYEKLKPSAAVVIQVEAAIKALRGAGFTVDYRPGDLKRRVQTPAISADHDHPQVVANREAKAARRKAVIEATDAAIIELWSNDDFDIQTYFESIDSSAS